MNPVDQIVCRPIGIVHSSFKQTAGVPIQTAAAPEEPGTLEVFPEFVPGLRDLEHFEYLILLTHMHLRRDETLEVIPFLDDELHGVFATRAPGRPNRIGLSIVRLESIEGGVIRFRGNDMVDQTPVLDIKPYVPAFDVRQTDRVGWLASKLDKLAGKRSDKRMG